ncbi:tetratricopeptide repeat protein [Candidatus Babeliales bacterium]|nr:tetratricopeptide repeat protein [Candidatus Babeliales bacterium]
MKILEKLNLKQLLPHRLNKTFKNIGTCLGLALLTFTTYFKSLRYDFVFDDLPTITNNFYIKTKTFSQLFLNHSRWISWILNKVTYKLYQLNPFGYRLGGLLIHIGVGILIFFLISTILQTYPSNSFLKQNIFKISTLSSGIFLLHPAITQTATYVTQARLEGLAALFILLTTLTFIYAAKTKNIKLKIPLYILCYLLVFLSAGTKEITIILPVILLLVDYFFIAKGNLRSLKKRILIHLGFFILIVGAFFYLGRKSTLINIFKLKTEIANNRGNVLTKNPKDKISPFIYLISQFKIILHYAFIYFCPLGLSFDYDWKLAKTFWSFEVLAPLLIILLILGAALFLFLKLKNNIFSFCIFWFFITMLPRASIVPSSEFVCDYKTYLPSIGLILLIGIGLTKFFNLLESKFKKNWYLFAVVFLLFLSSLTYNRNLVWNSRISLWEDVIKKYPNRARALNNYAVGLYQAGRKNEAIKTYLKAIKADPRYAEPVVNLANAYQNLGKSNEAMELYKKALNMNEFHPELFNNLGSLHFSEKRYGQAEESFKIALKLNPYYGNAHFNLGRTYQLQNRIEEASLEYEKALNCHLKTPQLYYVYGEVCYQLQKWDLAILNFEILHKTIGSFLQSRFILGNIYYIKKNYKKASENFEYVYNQNPSPLIAYNLAQSLRNIGNLEMAQSFFEKCSKHYNQLPYAAIHNASCLKELGKWEEAIIVLKAFVKTTDNEKIKKEAIKLLNSI